MPLYKYPKVNEIYYHTGFQAHMKIMSVNNTLVNVELLETGVNNPYKNLSYGISMWDYFTRNSNIILAKHAEKSNVGHPLTKIFK
jgi:hypothetical protein